MKSFYHIEILVNGSWTFSRSFATIRAARKYAKWCREKWETKIVQGGLGGMVVS